MSWLPIIIHFLRGIKYIIYTPIIRISVLWDYLAIYKTWYIIVYNVVIVIIIIIIVYELWWINTQ